MTTLAEIENAISRLSPEEVEELGSWLDRMRGTSPDGAEPDFVARSKEVWGEKPTGKLLSELVSEGRG